MMSSPLATRISAVLDSSGIRTGALDHVAGGMHFLRHNHTTVQEATLYQPLLCLVLQGAKEVGTIARTLKIADGQSLLVSHTLPVTSRITEAQPSRPYIALVLPIDLDLLRGLVSDAPALPSGTQRDPFSISLSQTDPDLEDALSRYLEQTKTELCRTLIAPITLSEIHARLLIGPHGAQLQKLLWHETTTSRVFRATQHIQANLSSNIVIADLAEHAGMSSSAFFEQFKAVTGTSPLQYQKDLRLLQARDALRTTGSKVSEIANRVGYESSAQFSREYSRKFGHSPRIDRVSDAIG